MSEEIGQVSVGSNTGWAEFRGDHTAEYASIFKTVYTNSFLEFKCAECALEAAVNAVEVFKDILED